MVGCRPGKSTFPRRFLARGAARDLRAFVIPGLDVAHAYGLFPIAAGLRLATTPRHANVLLVVGELPPQLARAAAVVCAQMPPPWVILALGSEPSPPLPRATLVAPLDQRNFEAAVGRLRDIVARSAWSESAPEPFALPPQAATESPTAMAAHGEMKEAAHSEAHREAMEHRDHAAGDNQAPIALGHAESGHMVAEHGGHAESGHMVAEHGGHEHHEPVATGGEAHDADLSMTMDHGNHGGHSGGAMSMAMMTESLPRSPDGLPMEWLEVPFGPLFPGLPGGLDLHLTLDGDTVARADVGRGVVAHDLAEIRAAPIRDFAVRLAAAHPLAQESYRILATRALAAAGLSSPVGDAPGSHVTALEYERLLSHLNWLSTFSLLIGDDWLASQSVKLLYRLRATRGSSEISGIRPAIIDFVGRVAGLIPLRWRLTGLGHLSWVDAAEARGPVARASGLSEDARNEDPLYRQLGFTPVTASGGDVWARLCVRLGEIRQSLELIEASGTRYADQTEPGHAHQTGDGWASIETPRGRAAMRVTVEDDEIGQVELDAPSEHNIRLVAPVTLQEEVGDALAAVASLDLSPRELAP